MSSTKNPGCEQPPITDTRISSALHFVQKICEREGEIFSFLLVVATLQVCYELVLRYVFNAPTVWGLELTLYLCSTTYIMAGAYAGRFDAHIKIDVFYSRWSPRTQALLDLFLANVLFFVFCGLLVWHSGAWLWEAISQNLTSGTIWDPPIWPMRLVIFVGSCFLLLSGIGRFISDIYTAIHNRRPS
jgi:TRAP-type mannitol/chloroaromatic compound transport system permease small subunit